MKQNKLPSSVFHVKHEGAQLDVCDYEGSDYKQRFWTRERRYEDLVEREALKRMLPPAGQAIADLGAGFGRLADLYAGYEQVFLVDYSRSMLQQARQMHEGDNRFTYVAADVRRLPLASGAFDAVLTVRVLHHLRDVGPAIQEAARVLAPGGIYLLEFANKRHLKAIARYLTRRQPWNPFDRQPIEFAELNFDFHPAYMRARLQEAGLQLEQQRALSLFRWQPLKEALGARWLAQLDAFWQPLASLYPLSPSVMMRARSPASATPRPAYLLACPNCHGALQDERQRLLCLACRRYWPRNNGIYDFKGDGRVLY
ncbi:MAG: methyltransferase domain-containing protein [Anaerolineae bacterium]